MTNSRRTTGGPAVEKHCTMEFTKKSNALKLEERVKSDHLIR